MLINIGELFLTNQKYQDSDTVLDAVSIIYYAFKKQLWFYSRSTDIDSLMEANQTAYHIYRYLINDPLVGGYTLYNSLTTSYIIENGRYISTAVEVDELYLRNFSRGKRLSRRKDWRQKKRWYEALNIYFYLMRGELMREALVDYSVDEIDDLITTCIQKCSQEGRLRSVTVGEVFNRMSSVNEK